jgi:uncharacterized protein YecE (DUF72 family)
MDLATWDFAARNLPTHGPRAKDIATATTKTGAIRIGVGGWTYEPWRGAFYPDSLTQKDELKYLSRQLTSIEINGTYYGAQKPATFAKWRDAAPDGFVFSVKAPRFVMNRTVLAGAGSSIEKFLRGGVAELKEKLGPINWQFLPTKKFEPADFESFLKLLPKKAQDVPLRHVVEVRHASFRSVDFIALLREYAVAVVLAGDSAHPQIADATAPFIYARIMGTTAKNTVGYSDAVLKLWASRAINWASGGSPNGLDYVGPAKPYGEPRDVYLYVISGHKVSNPAAARSLIELLN